MAVDVDVAVYVDVCCGCMLWMYAVDVAVAVWENQKTLLKEKEHSMDVKKAVKAVAVGALVVTGAVGILMAQSHPWSNTVNQVDIVDGNRGTRVSLEASYEVSNRAAIVAIPNNSEKLWSLDRVHRVDSITGDGSPSDSIGGINVLGNIGFLAVESNMSGWDVLVTLANNGKLVRAPREGESGDTLSHAKDTCDITYDYNFNEILTCTEIPAKVSGGVALKKKIIDGTTGPTDVTLEVGVGIIRPSVYNDLNSSTSPKPHQFKPPTLLDGIRGRASGLKGNGSGSRDSVIVVDAKLKFNANGTASIAQAIDSVATNVYSSFGAFGANGDTYASTDSLLFYGADSVNSLSGISGGSREGFPKINTVHAFNLYNLPADKLGSPENMDRTMFFSVTGGLGLWTNDGGWKQNSQLVNNKNGIYSETLTFTFWGMYQ